MSQSKSRYEAERWLLTAQEDFEAAKSLQEAGKFSHACFFYPSHAPKKQGWFLFGGNPKVACSTLIHNQ